MGNELCMTYLTGCYDKLNNNPPPMTKICYVTLLNVYNTVEVSNPSPKSSILTYLLHVTIYSICVSITGSYVIVSWMTMRPMIFNICIRSRNTWKVGFVEKEAQSSVLVYNLLTQIMYHCLQIKDLSSLGWELPQEAVNLIS